MQVAGLSRLRHKLVSIYYCPIFKKCMYLKSHKLTFAVVNTVFVQLVQLFVANFQQLFYGFHISMGSLERWTVKLLVKRVISVKAWWKFDQCYRWRKLTYLCSAFPDSIPRSGYLQYEKEVWACWITSRSFSFLLLQQ